MFSPRSYPSTKLRKCLGIAHTSCSSPGVRQVSVYASGILTHLPGDIADSLTPLRVVHYRLQLAMFRIVQGGTKHPPTRSQFFNSTSKPFRPELSYPYTTISRMSDSHRRFSNFFTRLTERDFRAPGSAWSNTSSRQRYSLGKVRMLEPHRIVRRVQQLLTERGGELTSRGWPFCGLRVYIASKNCPPPVIASSC